MSEKFHGETPENVGDREKQKRGIIDRSIVDKFLAEDSEGYTDTWRLSRAGDVRENLILMQLLEDKTSYKLEPNETKTDEESDEHYKKTGKFLSNYLSPTREQYIEAVEVAEAYLTEVKEREHKGTADVVEHLVLIPEDQHYKVEPGQVFDGVSHFVDRVRKSQEKVTKLLPHIPWGNLGGTKGIRPLIEAFDTVEAYSGYLPDTEKGAE